MASVGACTIYFAVILSVWIHVRGDMVAIDNKAHDDEFCQWESFNASCPSNAVILMTKAHYGRMKIGRCMSRDYYIGCYNNVITEADDRCSGRRKCTIAVPDPQMHDLQPCPNDLGAYLEAQYTCITVQSPTRQRCHSFNPIRVDQSSGYLASIVALDTGYGSARCPWKLQVLAGQRINITLLDFGTKKNILRKDSTFCPVYAKIKEPGETRETTVCGDTVREKRVYTSIGNDVEISLEVTPSRDYKQHFVFKYEVVGCATPASPIGGWVQRDGDTLIIGCNRTSKKWHLVCQDTHWVGHYDNCSSGAAWSVLGQVFPGESEFPFGLVLSVIIGVLLGVVIGATLLGVVLHCRRRSIRRAGGEGMLCRPYGQPSGQGFGYGESAVQKWGAPGAHGAQYSSYAHIWEMKQPADQQPGDVTVVPYGADNVPTVVSARDNPPTSALARCQSQSRAKEHIYESPKFDRKSSQDPYPDPPFYHEFDADEQPDRSPAAANQNASNKQIRKCNVDDSRYSS